MTDPRNSEDANLAGNAYLKQLYRDRPQTLWVDVENQDTTGWVLTAGGIVIPSPVGWVFIPEADREQLRYYSSKFPLRPEQAPTPRPAASPSGVSVAGGWCAPSSQVYFGGLTFGPKPTLRDAITEALEPTAVDNAGGLVESIARAVELAGYVHYAEPSTSTIETRQDVLELEGPELRQWARQARTTLRILALPEDSLNQLVTDAIFHEED